MLLGRTVPASRRRRVTQTSSTCGVVLLSPTRPLRSSVNEGVRQSFRSVRIGWPIVWLWTGVPLVLVSVRASIPCSFRALQTICVQSFRTCCSHMEASSHAVLHARVDKTVQLPTFTTTSTEVVSWDVFYELVIIPPVSPLTVSRA